MGELKNVTGIDLLVKETVSALETRGAELTEKYAPLVSIATTPENLKERKSDKAAIGNASKELNAERIAFEKQWKSAIEPITSKYKEVAAQLDGYANAIGSDLSEFEQARIESKKRTIKDIFDSVDKPSEVADWISLESIYNSKWENATFKGKDIDKEISDHFAMLFISYTNLKGMKHPYEEDGLKVLKETRDFNLAVSKMNELAEQERIIEGRRKAAEQREQERLAAAALAQEQKRKEEEAQKEAQKSYRERAEEAMDMAEKSETPADFHLVPDPEPAKLPFGNPTLVPVYTIKCKLDNKFHLEMVKSFLDNAGIPYEVGKEMIEG